MIISLTPIQYILLAILFFAISRVYLRVRDGSISFTAFVFWMGLFFTIGATVIDPLYTTYLAKQLGIGRGVDILIYVSVIVLFYLVFRTNIMLENLRHELTRLVREIALQNTKGKNSKPKK